MQQQERGYSDFFSVHTLRQLSSWNSIVKWTAGRQQDEVAQLWNEHCQVKLST
jgi:hypothetical protein